MNQKDYNEVSKKLVGEATGIEDSKRPGYTGGNVDVLHNFKSVAQRAGITTEQAWAIYFLKHIDAILSIMTKPDLPVSEAPIGRFSDAINYLKLGFAIYTEREQNKAAIAPQQGWRDRDLEQLARFRQDMAQKAKLSERDSNAF